MNTVSAFTLTFIQLCLVLTAIYLQRTEFTDTFLLYGSPVYLIINFNNLSPYFYTQSLSHFFLLTFQTFKYFFLIRSYTNDPPSFRRMAAFIMEAIYLILSCHYVIPAAR